MKKVSFLKIVSLLTIVPFLNYCYEKAKQHKKFLILIGFVVVVFVTIRTFYYCYDLVFIYPVNQVSQYNINNVTEKANLINQYRTTSIQLITTIAQIFGGIAILFSLYFAWGNLTTARDGQITERFTRAVDQLGNGKIEIRLGGIYALERIANESETDYWSIMEILTAYVRMNSSVEVVKNKKNMNILMYIQDNGSTKKDVSGIRKLPFDIQAVLTVIGRCKYAHNNGEYKKLNLSNTYLNGVEIAGANFKGTNFIGAHFEGANLKGANLSFANLKETNFEEANLSFAKLFGAHFEGANLKNAQINGADFNGAHLDRVNLERANLERANLESPSITQYLQWGESEGFDRNGITLREANLKWANLRGTHLEEANFLFAKLENADLERANLKKALFGGANLFGANFVRANLEEADLSGAKNLTIDQLSKVKTLYNAKLDKELLNILKDTHPDLFENPLHKRS